MSLNHSDVTDWLAACLRGERPPWLAGIGVDEVAAMCDHHGVAAVVHRRLAECAGPSDWPGTIRIRLERDARAGAAREAIRGREVARVVSALTDAGVSAILLKGTALAYSVYDYPGLRPRGDTDLLIPGAQVHAVREIAPRLGYAATTYSDGELLFCQFEVARIDSFGVAHAFDVHWKLSTQPLFAELLTFEELAHDAVPVPALGPGARAAGREHALLLACVHPVMHHRSEFRLIWLLDIHMLFTALTPLQIERFAALAIDKRVATICRHAIEASTGRLGTQVPGHVIDRLRAAEGREPTAAYLQNGRRWHHELFSSLGALPTIGDRLQLLREIVFPRASYMLEAYGVRRTRFSPACLPALYLHRGAHGAWKVLAGRK